MPMNWFLVPVSNPGKLFCPIRFISLSFSDDNKPCISGFSALLWLNDSLFAWNLTYEDHITPPALIPLDLKSAR